MMINRLGKLIHENNQEKGFWLDSENPLKTIASLGLISTEVSEAIEADRKDKYADMTDVLWDDMYNKLDEDYFKHSFEEYCKDTFEDELADIMIRVMDLAHFKGIDLEAHIKAKFKYNKLRPYKHGKKY